MQPHSSKCHKTYRPNPKTFLVGFDKGKKKASFSKLGCSHYTNKSRGSRSPKKQVGKASLSCQASIGDIKIIKISLGQKYSLENTPPDVIPPPTTNVTPMTLAYIIVFKNPTRYSKMAFLGMSEMEPKSTYVMING